MGVSSRSIGTPGSFPTWLSVHPDHPPTQVRVQIEYYDSSNTLSKFLQLSPSSDPRNESLTETPMEGQAKD